MGTAVEESVTRNPGGFTSDDLVRLFEYHPDPLVRLLVEEITEMVSPLEFDEMVSPDDHDQLVKSYDLLESELEDKQSDCLELEEENAQLQEDIKRLNAETDELRAQLAKEDTP